MKTEVHPIVLYDGVCGLCDRFNRFVLARDRHGVLRFAALQSAVAHEILERHGSNADDLDMVCVVIDRGLPSERVERGGKAVLYVLRRMGCPRWILACGSALPPPILDFGYRLIARTRYRFFGRYPRCALPDPAWRERFIATE